MTVEEGDGWTAGIITREDLELRLSLA